MRLTLSTHYLTSSARTGGHFSLVLEIYNFGFKPVFLSFQIEWPWHCERHCKHVPTDASRNMIILAGDRMLAANCDLATNLKTGTRIWSKEQTPMHNVKNLR